MAESRQSDALPLLTSTEEKKTEHDVEPIVLVFHNPENKFMVKGLCQSYEEKGEVDVEALVRKIIPSGSYDRIVDPKPPKSEHKTRLPNLLKLIQRKTATMQDIRSAFRKDVVHHMAINGCSNKTFISVDDDEMFLRFAFRTFIEKEEDKEITTSYAQVHAESYGIKCQLDFKILEKINIGQKKEDTIMPYIVYDLEVDKKIASQYNLHSVFRQYGELDQLVEETTDEGRTLGRVDEIRLMEAIIAQIVDLDACVQQSLLKESYPLHEQQRLKNFSIGNQLSNPPQKAWATLFAIFNEQPFEEIRSYFGERIAFTFVWSGYTMWMMCFLAPCLLPLAIMARTETIIEDSDKRETVVYVGSATVILIWTAFYEVWWQRTVKDYLIRWGCPPAVGLLEKPRPEYLGEQTEAPWNSYLKRRDAGSWSQFGRQMLSHLCTALSLAIVVSAVLYIYHLLPYLVETYGHKQAKSMISYAFTAQITVFGLIWDSTSMKLVEFENHRSEREFRNSLIGKLFIFNFVSTYFPFFYTALGEHYNEADPCMPKEGGYAMKNDCTLVLRDLITQTMVPAVFLQVVKALIPFAQYKVEVYFEQKKAVKDGGQQLAFMEIQAKRPRYDLQAQVADLNTAVIQLGYLLLFGATVPISAVIVFIFLLISIRVRAWMLVSVYQRPSPGPKPVTGIGEWNYVIHWLILIGRYTAIAVPVINAPFFVRFGHLSEDNPYPKMSMVVIILCFKTVGDMVSHALELMVGHISKGTQMLITKHEYYQQEITDRVFGGKRKGKERKEEEPPFHPETGHAKLDSNHADWKSVEKFENFEKCVLM